MLLLYEQRVHTRVLRCKGCAAAIVNAGDVLQTTDEGAGSAFCNAYGCVHDLATFTRLCARADVRLHGLPERVCSKMHTRRPECGNLSNAELQPLLRSRVQNPGVLLGLLQESENPRHGQNEGKLSDLEAFLFFVCAAFVRLERGHTLQSAQT
eukprot:1110482-Pelagomonas_calceolata.AAC.4